MRRLFVCLLCLMLSAVPLPARAETEGVDGIEAPNYVVVDASDPSTALYSRLPDSRVAPCSTLKILTCLLAIEKCSLSDMVTVSKKAAGLPETNSLMGLKAGERLSMQDLLYGLMLCSGNDAALAIAEHVSGTQEAFVELMNLRAAELGMVNSYFVNCFGSHRESQYTTAADMAILSCYAIKNEIFRTIAGTACYTAAANEVRKRPIEMVSSNWLLGTGAERFSYEHAIGGKTGSAASQGKCLVAMAEKDGVTLVCCMYALKDGGDRGDRLQILFADTKLLFEESYDKKYTAVSASDLNLEFSTVVDGVSNAEAEADRLTLKSLFSEDKVLLNRDTVAAVGAGLLTPEFVPALDAEISAPIVQGQVLGSVACVLNGRLLFSGELVAEHPVARLVPTAEPTAAPTPAPTPVSTVEPVIKPTASAPGDGETAKPSLVSWLLTGGAALIAACLIGLVILNVRSKRNKEKQ